MHHRLALLALASAASLAAAAPTRRTSCPPGTDFYVCASTGFRGCCSQDVCALELSYCPASPYEFSTTTTPPATYPTTTPPVYPSTNCSTIPPPKTRPTDGPKECPAGTSFYICASTGFRGCCSQNVCALELSYCPGDKAIDPPTTCDCSGPHHETTPTATPTCTRSTTTTTTTPSPPPTCAPNTGYYQVCANGFKGCCAADACTIGYCPVDEQKGGHCHECEDEPPVTLTVTAAAAPTSVPEVAARSDASICAPGTGYYQVCASGFKGCCTADACGLGWCPSAGVKPPPVEVEGKKEGADKKLPEGQCKTGTGYYQVCGNGFKGCCKKDACSLGFCPA